MRHSKNGSSGELNYAIRQWDGLLAPFAAVSSTGRHGSVRTDKLTKNPSGSRFRGGLIMDSHFYSKLSSVLLYLFSFIFLVSSGILSRGYLNVSLIGYGSSVIVLILGLVADGKARRLIYEWHMGKLAQRRERQDNMLKLVDEALEFGEKGEQQKAERHLALLEKLMDEDAANPIPAPDMAVPNHSARAEAGPWERRLAWTWLMIRRFIAFSAALIFIALGVWILVTADNPFAADTLKVFAFCMFIAVASAMAGVFGAGRRRSHSDMFAVYKERKKRYGWRW